MPKDAVNKKTVLVGVLKNRNDRRILLGERWYRIPAEFSPKRRFDYVAFYQPAIFGRKGKQIEYYAKVAGKNIRKRIELLPKEITHPRANSNYLKIKFKKIERLARPVKNIIPRRVSFGFASLKDLLSARDILELYGVPKTEQIIEARLKRLGIKTMSQYQVSASGKRFRIDLAVLTGNRCLAIECDNRKAHAGKSQKAKDKIKDSCLRRAGWDVIRLEERNIVENLDSCVDRISHLVKQTK